MFSGDGSHGGSVAVQIEGFRYNGKGLKRKVSEVQGTVLTVSEEEEDCESEVLGGAYGNLQEILARKERNKKKKKKKKQGFDEGFPCESNFVAVDEEVSTTTSLETEDQRRWQEQQQGKQEEWIFARRIGRVDEEEVSSGDEFMEFCEEEDGVKIVASDDANGDDEEDRDKPGSTYILSSGRQTSQVEKKIPTIDDEFEEYFRQLML